MKKIILQVEVSDTVYDSIRDTYNHAEKSAYDNLIFNISIADTTVRDSHRLIVLDLIALSAYQNEGE